jgi:hypothetical protein
VACAAVVLLAQIALAEPKKPNIIWIIVDDMSANFSCYGEQKTRLEAMRKRLTDWEEQTNDLGCKPEPMTMYDSDMAVYLPGEGGLQKNQADELKRTIDLNKKWLQEGK